LLDIRALGFEALELWVAHLNAAWATHEHLEIASELLARHGLRVVSLCGAFGETREEFERTCHVATAVAADVLGGRTELYHHNRSAVLSMLSERGLRLAIENHPERAPDQMLVQIGDRGDGFVGTTVDTGWYANEVVIRSGQLSSLPVTSSTSISRMCALRAHTRRAVMAKALCLSTIVFVLCSVSVT
jgi:sugar phosphate isomerase/epimerase